MTLKNQVQLITYPDSLGGGLKQLHQVLHGPLDGLFAGGFTFFRLFRPRGTAASLL